ncbi:MAG: tetratricopeptide repeat protein [Rhodothermales bacterium]
MRRYLTLFLIALLTVGLTNVGAAQGQSDPLEEGKQAFREERYADAARIFERVAEKDPANAEAHFLVARVYFETSLHNDKKARKALERALELEPENVEFLVAQLQQLRTESWNFFSERIKEAKRLETSMEILKLDPDNAFAHEELGTVYIRDFWRYRNAIMLPTLQYGNPSGFERSGPGSRTVQITGVGITDNLEDQDAILTQLDSQIEPYNPAFITPDQVFLADRFDLETLREQGVPFQDLSARAQRAYQRAIGHLKKALEVDPRRRSVYDEMMQIYALKGEYEDALTMLEEMYRFFPEDAALWQFLGLTHYQLGHMDAADRSFATAFEYMEPDEIQAYQSLDFILPQDEKRHYKDDPVAYASRFWTSKDPRYLTPYNERKLAHYFRLTYADLLYGSPGLDLRGWETQRGQILVRYGPPRSDVVIIPQQDGIYSARQTLVGAIFSTINGTDEQGNLTAELNISGTQSFGNVFTTAAEAFEEMNAYNIWEYGSFRFVFEDPFRNGEYRMYSPPASEMSESVISWQNDYVIRSKEIFHKIPEQYTYQAPGRQVELPYLVTAFKGEGGQTDLYVHYGVPITQYDPAQEMIEITANTGTFLISESRDILVERRRTIYGLRTDQIIEFKEQNLWVDTQQMQAPPGKHEVSVEFETASGNTVAVQRREILVPDFSQDKIALSDLMLAYRVEEVFDGKPLGANEIVRNNLSILPAPWSVYATDWPIYLYFETYNLERGPDGQTDYDVEIVLAPKETAKGISKLFKAILGGDKGVAVSYHGNGSLTDEGLYQILDASDQEMGLYTLVLRVRDNIAKKTVESQQDLFLEQ